MSEISWQYAKQLLQQGKEVFACPSKLSPWSFNQGFLCVAKWDQSLPFETWYKHWKSNFKWYNCNLPETGYGIRWYL